MELLDDEYRKEGAFHRSVEDLQQQGYQTDVYRYIREGFEIFRKNPLLFIVFTLFIAAIGYATSRVRMGGLLNLFIYPCLGAGWYLAAKRLSFDQPLEFRHFFDGFRRWEQLVPYTLVAHIFTVIGIICLVLPGIYLAISYLFITPIVLFYNRPLSLMDTIEGSRLVITKKWWNFFGLFGLVILLNIAGALCLGIGLLVTIPVTMCSFYAAYEDIFGIPDPEAGVFDG